MVNENELGKFYAFLAVAISFKTNNLDIPVIANINNQLNELGQKNMAYDVVMNFNESQQN